MSLGQHGPKTRRYGPPAPITGFFTRQEGPLDNTLDSIFFFIN